VARHYLDHASTSPPRPEAVAAMVEWLGRAADPGRVHTEGRMVRVAIEEARDQVAALVGARQREVVFTSSATEAANAAVWGAMAAAPHGAVVALAGVEHSCVRDASARHKTVPLAVDHLGRIELDSVDTVLRDESVGLLHCQFANHEVGTRQRVAEIVARCRAARVLVHVDAAQAVGHVPIDFRELGADLLSLSGHKFGGPPGVGALVIRRGLRLDPLLVGGDQERARRAGMENVPAIVGLGAAAQAVAATMAAEQAAAVARTTRMLGTVTAVDGVTAYGDTSEAGRLPHLICAGIEGTEAEAVLLGLDQAGIAAHSGSACSSEALEPSPVLEAMGVDAERSLRLSVGWNTTDADIDAVARAFPAVIEKLRALAG
jgi:cysteine desulfurase